MQKLTTHFARLKASLPVQGPGFSAVVLQDGVVALELHHGMASLELQVPLTGHSSYYFASESKQFTAACILTLVRKGLISLDDNVVPYLPELSKFDQKFPLKSLLNHSSGIPDYFQFIHCQMARHEADYFDNCYILKLIAHCDTVDFPTSTEYRYSNSNYILLATLVARLTGTSLGEFAKATLFKPLQMYSLGFDEDRFSVIKNRVCSYEADPGRPYGYKQNLGNANTVGDGGIYGSTNDMLQWERDWHAQWGNESSLLHAMLQPSPLLGGQILPYRFGLEISRYDGHDVIFHSGGLWGFDTLVLRLPHRRMSIIHLANCEAAGPDMKALIEAALA
jgi:CubicO group peptidase (beta-lactamase class C family)